MIFIRTDANEVIASGHVMRCLTIADEIVNLGNKVCFIVSDNQSLSLIQDRGFKYIITNSEWDNVNPQKEYKILKQHIKSTDLLLVDSYYIDNRYLNCMHRLMCKIATFDDMFTEKKDADIIINYNIFYKNFDYEGRYKNSNSILLLGERYVPLRKQFRKIHPMEHVRNFVRPKVLIMCGGGDSKNFIYSCLDYIYTNNIELFYRIDWKVVVGNYYPHMEQLNEISSENKNVHILKNVKNMAELMINCDICITAASTVLYECCAMLLPTLFAVVADDQKYDAEAFSKDDMMIYCGNFLDDRDNVRRILLKELETLTLNRKRLQNIKNKMRQLIDVDGARRIASILKEISKNERLYYEKKR